VRQLGFIFVWLLIASMVTGGSALADQAEVEVVVRIDRDTIGLDEQATLVIEVSGSVRNLPEPRLPSLPTFEVYSQGQSSNISIINGKMSSSVTYRYLLLPQKSGSFPIEQVAVVYENQRFVGNRVEITILDKGTATTPQLQQSAVDPKGGSKDYFLQAVVDKKNPYVNEQVTLTLKFYVAVQYYGSPELTEPTTIGFWTEVVGNKSPYWQNVGGRRYRVIERKYALFPTQTGELTIGRATIRTTVAARKRSGGTRRDVFADFFGRGSDVSTSSRPIKIDVRPLPREGRPADFSGTIGRFTISAVADKTEVEVNQPVTVTFRLKGTGNIKSAGEPNLPELEDFRVYRASSNEKLTVVKDKIGGTKTYEEVFIPKRAGTLEIPAIQFSYFDPEKGKYRQVATKPIKVRVKQGQGYADSPNLPYSTPGQAIGSDARDIRYVRSDLGDLQPMGRLTLFTPLYLALNGAPILLLLVFVSVRRWRHKLNGDVGYARARTAGKTAKKRLARANSLASVDTAGEFFAEINAALTQYIADKLNISPYGLTSDLIKDLLEERSADENLVRDVIELLRQCDFARFAPGSVSQSDLDTALIKARSVMTAIGGIRFV